MKMNRSVFGVLLATVATVACGGDDSSAPVGAQPWSLDPTATTAGAGVAFCDQAMADVATYMSQFEGQMPPSDEYGGTAVVATIGEIPDGMNGFVSSDNAASQHQNFVNLMSLIQYDEELNAIPYLAESWDVSEDNTELTFHIRNDVFWHDGERTDAYDVAFTYEVATNPLTGFPNGNFWTYYERGPGAVEVVDSFTVKFKMQPHSEFLDPWRTLTIMPEHLLGDVDPVDLKQHPFGTVCPVGNGPFIFTQHRQDASWSFQANPSFPESLGGRPYLDRYVFRIITEQNTLLADLLTESIDVYIAVKPDQAERVQAAEDLELIRYPFRQYVFVGWNSRKPYLADKRVRQAITRGTNRAEMVDALVMGFGSVSNGSIPPFHWAYDADAGAESMSYDPEAAAELLEEAGWIDRNGDGVRENVDGDRLSMVIKYNLGNDIRRDVAEIMQAQLSQIGIEVKPQVVEWATLVNDITVERDFDGVVFSWVVEFKLDDTDLFHSDKYEDLYAFSGTKRADIDRLLEEIPLVVDRADALPLWEEYQRILLDEQPYTFVYFPERMDGVNMRLEDVVMDIRGEWINLKDWKIAPENRRRR
jgi:peptide/nickel transport system substrate-binding protein